MFLRGNSNMLGNSFLWDCGSVHDFDWMGESRQWVIKSDYLELIAGIRMFVEELRLDGFCSWFWMGIVVVGSEVNYNPNYQRTV